MKVAILGATGHLSKCAFWVFSKDVNNEFFLFSRSTEMLKQTELYREFPIDRTHFENYEQFAINDYDVIFNGVGVWDTPGCHPCDIFAVTEYYDNIILEYQKAHPYSVSIHISSGAAYAGDYTQPVEDMTKTQLNINKIRTGDYYSIAKINSEAKHRAFNNLHIVDIRLFGFFSRFMNLEYPYLLSALINSVKGNTKFKAIRENFWRDYIHMNDFSAMLLGIVAADKINTAVDARSSQPISKEELIRLFVGNYGLKIQYDDNVDVSTTGVKPYYYSRLDNAVYTPHYSSLQTVKNEIEYFLGGKI
jgi:nucleoside-diphosphate-sugar epimerase